MTVDGIALWQFNLGGGPGRINAALELLCPDERRQFRPFDNTRLAHAFAVRRAARRIILAHHLGGEPSEVSIHDASTGKPQLRGHVAGLHFNASHSKDRGILSVSSQFPVGADIECLRSIDTDMLSRRVLSPPERHEFVHAAPADRAAGIFTAWTAKEAIVKGIGIGLDLDDLTLISLPFAPAPAVWQPVALGGRMAVHGEWYVYPLAPSGGYYISLAAPAAVQVALFDAGDLLAGWGL
jgi:4'-phosphopantetheinyl transferase